MRPSAFYSMPLFALHLVEVVRAEGYGPRNFGLQHMFFQICNPHSSVRLTPPLVGVILP
jgi:hypothetical protein